MTSRTLRPKQGQKKRVISGTRRPNRPSVKLPLKDEPQAAVAVDDKSRR